MQEITALSANVIRNLNDKIHILDSMRQVRLIN